MTTEESKEADLTAEIEFLKMENESLHKILRVERQSAVEKERRITTAIAYLRGD